MRGVALCLTCLVLSWYGPASGQVQGREVVLVLDDSGSMRQNDPRGLARQSGGMFVRLMDTDGSLAIITFANSAEVVLPMSGLADEAVKERGIGAISAMTYSGGLTHIEAAIERGFSQFSTRPDVQRTLLLMTDGVIDLDNNPGRANPAEAASRQRILDNWVARYKESQIPVYTIAFGHDTDEPLLREIAKATGGMFFKIAREADVAPTYFKIFNQIEKPQYTPITDGGFNVDPTIREATVIVEAPKDPEAVVIQDPKGRRYRRSVPTNKVRWGGSDSYLLATVSKPREGTWRVLGIEDGCGKVIVLTDVKLLAPEPRSTYSHNEPIYLLARMDLGIGEMTLPIDLRIRAELIDDTGMVIDVAPLTNDGRGDCAEADVDRNEDAYYSGVFPAREERREGLYTVRVIAEADTFSRQREYSVRINPTPWLSFDSENLNAKPDHPLTLPFRFASEIVDTPGFRLHEQNLTLSPMLDTRSPFGARVQDPKGNWHEGSVSFLPAEQRLLLSLQAVPLEGDYIVDFSLLSATDALVCFAQQVRLTVPVVFPVGTPVTQKFKMGLLGWIGLGFGASLVLVLFILLQVNNRRTKRVFDDDGAHETPIKATPIPQPKPVPRPVVRPEPEPEEEPLDEPDEEPVLPPVAAKSPPERDTDDSNEISQSLDELMREMAKVDGLAGDNLHDPFAPPKRVFEPRVAEEPKEEYGESDENEEEPAPRPDPVAKIEQTRRAATGIDMSEIESIISKMDELTGSGKQDSGKDTSGFDSAPSLASIMEKDGTGGEDGAESKRAVLSRREYDAIDKAIDKMQRLATLRELTEGRPKPEGAPSKASPGPVPEMEDDPDESL